MEIQEMFYLEDKFKKYHIIYISTIFNSLNYYTNAMFTLLPHNKFYTTIPQIYLTSFHLYSHNGNLSRICIMDISRICVIEKNLE